jgi:uncharacterized membrane protein (DUF106 family)
MRRSQVVKTQEGKQMVARMVFAIPVFGWMLKEAARGNGNTKALFVVNMVLAWLLAILTFGYPAIIVPALVAVPVVFLLLILITAGG